MLLLIKFFKICLRFPIKHCIQSIQYECKQKSSLDCTALLCVIVYSHSLSPLPWCGEAAPARFCLIIIKFVLQCASTRTTLPIVNVQKCAMLDVPYTIAIIHLNITRKLFRSNQSECECIVDAEEK